MSINSILFTVGVTMLSMFALNQIAAVSPRARVFIRGGPVSLATVTAVPTGGSGRV